MTDKLSSDQSSPNSRDPSASSIFTEMMQQAAERQAVSRARTAPGESLAADVSTQLRLGDEPPPHDESPSPDSRRGQEQPAAMEQPRVRRIKGRQERHRRTALTAAGVSLRTLFVVLVSTGLVATILTWLTDPQFLNPAVVRGLQVNEAALIASGTAAADSAPAAAVTPNWLHRIGIISGHRGPSRTILGNDPGAVCTDGLEEAQINFEVARRVVANLRARNYTVDLLDEFDTRLDNYRAAALLSIHANTCQDFGERVSGYLVAKAASRPDRGIDAYFVECIAFHYEELIPIKRSYNLTPDMTDNHAWYKIHPLTPGVLIEMGYMLADRQILTEEPELLAQALSNGILCLLGSSASYPELPP